MRKDGGPAFPTESKEWAARSKEIHEGITLRDHFAGQALNGICANNNYDLPIKDLANWCYEMADAMIKARGVNK